MKKSSFLIKTTLVLAIGLFFTSCGKSLAFTFRLECGEDLLDFVTPTATFVDAKGSVQSIELTKDLFTKLTNESELVGDGVDAKIPVTYKWSKVLSTSMKATQRDMRITYRLRDSRPQINADKQYFMKHYLSGTYATESWLGGGAEISSTISLSIDGSDLYKVSGDKMNEFLQDLIENPDYEIVTVKD